MNHRDRVSKLADGFKKTAWTLNCPVAGMENKEKISTQYNFTQK